MTRTRRTRLAAGPLAMIGRQRRLEFPPSGTDLRFDLANYAYIDGLGRETFLYSRRFRRPDRVLRFDDTMVFSERRGCLINYLGSHQDVAAELHLSVGPSGELVMTGGGQRAFLGPLPLRIPSPVAAIARVVESWDEPADRFSISVTIAARGRTLSHYEGWFSVTESAVDPAAGPYGVPAAVRPVRERAAD